MPKKTTYLPICLFVVAFLAAWKNLYFDRLIPVDAMTLHLTYPLWTVFQHYALSPAHLLWNPLRNMGEPFLADPQAMVTYPIRWLMAPFQTFLGYTQAWVAIHSLIAAYFMRRLALRFYKDETAAAAAAVLFVLNGFFITRATTPNYFAAAALLPAILYFVAEGSFAGIGVALALQWLAGSPPFSFLTALLVLVLLLQAPPTSRRPIFLGGFLALGLAAVQWVPFLELLRHSVHAVITDPADAVIYSLSPAQLMKEFLLPQWYRVSPKIDGDLTEVCFYVGPIALALAAYGVRRGAKREKNIALGIGLALLLSLGSFLPGYRYLTPLHVLRFPGRWLLLATAGLALLCAAGFSKVQSVRWKWLLLAALSLDLVLFAAVTKTAWFPGTYLETTPALAQQMSRSPFPTRIYHSPYLENAWINQKLATLEDFNLVTDMLLPSYGMAFGVAEARSCQVLRLSRVDAFQERLRLAPPQSSLWNEAGISTVLALAPGAPQVDRAHIQIFQNTQAKPPLYLADGAIGTMTPRRLAAGHVEADLVIKKPGRLVFREAFYPGWEGRVDGQRTQISPYEDTFLSVPLSEGNHRAAFDFHSDSFRIGMTLSWLTLMGLVGVKTYKRIAR